MQLVGEMPFMADQDLVSAGQRFADAQATGTPIEVGSLHFEIDDAAGSYSGFTVGVRVLYLVPEKRVAAAVQEKLTWYPQEIVGSQPLVVAVCAGDQSITTEAVRTALYGREEFRQFVHRETREVAGQMVVRVGGIFKDPENRHLSAVVYCKLNSLDQSVVVRSSA